MEYIFIGIMLAIGFYLAPVVLTAFFLAVGGAFKLIINLINFIFKARL